MYGVSVETNYNQDADKTPRIILIKSNDNPASLADIKWEILSSVPVFPTYNITSASKAVCNVDEKGVFTYLGMNVYKTAGGLPETGGVQYSSNYPTNPGGTGPGGWKNIDTNGPFPWETGSYDTILFNVPDSSGNNVLIMAWSLGGYSSNLQFASLDPSTFKLQQGPAWKLPGTLSIMKKSYYNKTFYLLFSENISSKGLLTIPFDSPVVAPSAPTNFTGMGYQMYSNDSSSSIVAGFFLDNYYTIRRFNNGTAVDTLEVLNMANVKKAVFKPEVNLTTPINTFWDYTNGYDWCTVGGYAGSPVLGFFNRYDLTNTSHLEAVHLDGPKIGTWEYAPWHVNVSEPYGYFLNPPPPRTGPSSDSDGPSTGLIVGCVLGGLAIIGIAAFLFVFYSRRMTRELNEARAARDLREKEDQEYLQQPFQHSPPPNAGKDIKHKLEVPLPQTSAAPIEHSLQQQINLSHHPRPNMVSTLADRPNDDKAEIDEEHFDTSPVVAHHSSSQGSMASTPQIPYHSRPSP